MSSATFNPHALMEITARPNNIFTKGKGSWLWDQDARPYLDFVQGWAVNCLGHAPSLIADALSQQAQTLITPSPAYFNAPSIQLADLLTQKSCFDRVFFTNSGGEANEGAIKLARKYGEISLDGAYEIITFEGGFHGRTLATMSASGKKAFETMFEPKVPGFPKARLNDLQSVEQLISDNTVAVMLEPIQGEAGVLPATTEFLTELRALTASHGLLLIVDEIQTGIGRTGSLFHYEQTGIEPDIMTLGKGIGGGVPLGALLARESVCCFEHGEQGGTYNGNPLMCAVGLAVVQEVSKPEFLAAVVENGSKLRLALDTLSSKYNLGASRGSGLLLALDIKCKMGTQIVAQAMGNGLLINSPRPDTLRFMPALTISEVEINQMIDILDGVFEELL